jgi:hypothetical protein
VAQEYKQLISEILGSNKIASVAQEYKQLISEILGSNKIASVAQSSNEQNHRIKSPQ